MLDFFNLKQKPEWLEEVATWSENEWGYLRGNPGLDFRKNLLKNLFMGDGVLPAFMIASYMNKPIGTFAFMNYEFCTEITEKNKQRKIKGPLKLFYVYVHADYRDKGFGSAIVSEAKKMAKSLGYNDIIFDVLTYDKDEKPITKLTQFYKNRGASIFNNEFDQAVVFSKRATLFKLPVDSQEKPLGIGKNFSFRAYGILWFFHG